MDEKKKYRQVFRLTKVFVHEFEADNLEAAMNEIEGIVDLTTLTSPARQSGGILLLSASTARAKR